MRQLFAYTDYHSRHDDGLLSLLAWIAVPVIAYILVRFLFSSPRRRSRRVSMWEHIGHIVVYAVVSFVIWHLVRTHGS